MYDTKNLMEPKMWEAEIELPTYETGAPNKNPLFLEKRVYQGSSGKIYPLAFTDTISDKKVIKKYQVIYLENEYIQVMIMPSMGGKIYRAIDKTNNYDFVYYNQVVKPALVGLTGPWVSGGIEFNWPQHHRPSTFSEIEHTLVDNPDGSKTCWVSEIDRMYGTKGMAGFTIHKDKAYIEIKGQLYNRTEVPQTFLWWANPAVAVNDYTKSIFPPDVHAVFDHGKRDVSKFPIATGEYYKMDYSKGVDISRYKNIPVPTSYMAYHSDYNFVGGYDFGVEAGILHIANHHISPGKKQWTWGNGDFGKAWDRNLTDEDGPYIELMTGVYTDNQPDFTWLAPKEEKTFRQYFMPYKGVGEVKNASLDAMINLEIKEEIAHISLYVPAQRENITVKLLEDNQLIFKEEIVSITPFEVYKKHIELENMQPVHKYQLVIEDENQQNIISYQEKEPTILETPNAAEAPEVPEEVKTCEELFLIGQHIEQYRHATYLPEDYYLEGLKRNPDDIRNNNAYGLLMYRRGRFEIAEQYFRRAIATSIKRNPNPYDGEPYYNLGLALKRQEKLEQAYAAFYKSVWNGAWHDSGYYEIACIDTIKGDYDLALEHIEKSLVKNSHNIKARNLKTALFRMVGNLEEARRFNQQTLEIDMTTFGGLYEQYKLSEDDKAQDCLEKLKSMLRGYHQNYIELTIDYMNGGLYEDVIEILSFYTEEVQDVYPMIYYFKAHVGWQIEGLTDNVKATYDQACGANTDYCFPHRLEELIVLERAIANNVDDAKAKYYLGNLYYDKKQYDYAIQLWHESVEKDQSFPTASRNLGLAYANKKQDLQTALKYLENAFNSNPSDARVFFELDQLYKKLGYSYEIRLEKIEEYIELAEQRDDLFVEYLEVLNNVGAYQRAKELIEKRHFHPWEGGEGKVSGQYKMCRIELAKQAIIQEEYHQAIQLLQECKIYPDSLGEGKLNNTLENNIHYYMGIAFEALGESDQANSYYEKASYGIDVPTDAMYYNDQPADMMFYQGLALNKLGKSDQAKANFNKMFDFGEKHIRQDVKIDYFAVSLPDFLVFDEDLNVKNKIHCLYLMALGLIGNGDQQLAKQYLEQAYQMNPNHQGVLIHKKWIETF